ncbi:MAG TPA: hypothetical protein VGZ02_06850 [Candidatus Baltobacteraceae bacterium]|nr:hypothetical protein [Candidatus Baltobacteraceae bacterium]
MAHLRLGRLRVNVRFTRPAPGRQYDSKRAIRISFAASVLLHVLTLPFVVALFAAVLPPASSHAKPPEEIVSISSAIRLEKRARPIPPAPRRQTNVAERVQTRTAQAATPQPAPTAQIAALSRTDLHARTYYAPKHTRETQHATLSASELADQQAMFARTIAQAREQTDPVAAAARPVQPSSRRYYAFNIEGAQGNLHNGEGYLIPMKRWTDGPYTFYYVRYWVIYPDGTTEQGIVPWPIHYLTSDDPFARGIRHMPLPGPGPDFTASANDMQPLVKDCYDHRYPYCLIQHE